MTHIDVLQVELNRDHLSQIKKKLDSKNKLFADKRYLESLGPPIKIIGREKQAEKILEYLYSPKNGISSPFVSVYGKSGTGKSTVTKYVCENISDTASYCFVNLRRAKTNFECANLILEELDESKVKAYEGINHAFSKIEKKIQETLVLEKQNNFVLILDEFDVIFSDVRSRPTNFVYKLLDVVERLRTKGFFLCIVAISNSSLSDYSLDDRVKSRMDNCEVFFPPYTEEEILQILYDRAKKAFVKKQSSKVLGKCAKLCSQENGDCRRALHLLRLAGDLAKNNTISLNDVKNAYKKLDSDKLNMILDTVTPHQKFLLASFAKILLFSPREYYSTKEIFSWYQNLCGESDQQPLSYSRVFSLLVDLENTGIIYSKKNSDGRHGYHKFYKLTYEYDLVGSIIDMDWWWSQKDEKARNEIWNKIMKDALKDPRKEEQINSRLAIARNKFMNSDYSWSKTKFVKLRI